MLLMRHAQSEWNQEFGRTRVDPGMSDPSLTAMGIRQAQAAAERLALLEMVAVVSSPYRRCLHTAAVIAARCRLAIRVEPSIR